MSKQNETELGVLPNNYVASENGDDRELADGGETVTAVDGPNHMPLNRESSEINISHEIHLENKDFRHKIWQLVTFFLRVFIYFVVVILADSGQLFLPSWGRLIFKCLPVFTLSVFVYRQFNSLFLLWKNKYALLIFIGLMLSYVADGLLVYQNDHEGFFLAGLICFAIAHVLYTFAFGWCPLKSRMMVRSLIVAGLIYYYFYTGTLQNDGIVLLIGVAVYVTIIMAMQWRAWARLSYQDIKNGRYYEILGALGASFFALSDAILGINKFRFSVPGADYSILATYYLGQMLIALSVIDGPDNITLQDGQERIEGMRIVLKPSMACIKSSAKRIMHWLIS